MSTPEDAEEYWKQYHKDDELVRLVGAATVAWSGIEDTWLAMFKWLLFEKMGYLVEPDTAQVPSAVGGGGEFSRRAEAVYFSITSSVAQLQMVGALARVVLEDRPAQQSRVFKAISETGKLRGWRNAIAHAVYGPELLSMTKEGSIRSARIGRMTIVPQGTHRLVGKDPYAEIPKLIERFKALDQKLRDLMFDLCFPGEAQPSADTSPQPPEEQ